VFATAANLIPTLLVPILMLQRAYDATFLGQFVPLTLAHWRRRFAASLGEVRTLGFSEEFIRTWEFYFCYCEGGFRERMIGDVQMLFAKPRCRRAAAPIGTARRWPAAASVS